MSYNPKERFRQMFVDHVNKLTWISQEVRNAVIELHDIVKKFGEQLVITSKTETYQKISSFDRCLVCCIDGLEKTAKEGQKLSFSNAFSVYGQATEWRKGIDIPKMKKLFEKYELPEFSTLCDIVFC
jgi:hypothetical protein